MKIIIVGLLDNYDCFHVDELYHAMLKMFVPFIIQAFRKKPPLKTYADTQTMNWIFQCLSCVNFVGTLQRLICTINLNIICGNEIIDTDKFTGIGYMTV